MIVAAKVLSSPGWSAADVGLQLLQSCNIKTTAQIRTSLMTQSSGADREMAMVRRFLLRSLQASSKSMEIYSDTLIHVADDQQ
ncbi:hypothetical protein BGZ70_002795, partial [Mortierella alpina]